LFAASLLVLLLAPSEFLLICELLLFLALNIVCCQCFCLLDACSKTSSNQTYCLLIAYRTCCTYVCCLKERLRTHKLASQSPAIHHVLYTQQHALYGCYIISNLLSPALDT
jgi:hypothetical protein